MKGYQTPQKVVSSSYLDWRHRVSSFSLRPRHSTTLTEGDTQKDELEIIFLVFFVFLQKNCYVFQEVYPMWYLCCVCLPPVFLFSPPVHSVPYRTAAASRSAYRHTKSRQNIGGGDLPQRICVRICMFLTSQCWHAAWVSHSYLFFTDSRHSSR